MICSVFLVSPLLSKEIFLFASFLWNLVVAVIVDKEKVTARMFGLKNNQSKLARKNHQSTVLLLLAQNQHPVAEYLEMILAKRNLKVQSRRKKTVAIPVTKQMPNQIGPVLTHWYPRDV